jgi:hypothetical protein
VNVEEIAKGNQLISGFNNLTRRYVDIPILDEQEKYFGYTDALISYTNYEGRYRAGRLSSQPLPKPAQVSQPSLYL